MNKEETEYITELLSKVENLINLYMEDGLEKNNALTKISNNIRSKDKEVLLQLLR